MIVLKRQSLSLFVIPDEKLSQKKKNTQPISREMTLRRQRQAVAPGTATLSQQSTSATTTSYAKRVTFWFTRTTDGRLKLL
jgi:nitrate reductase assembly molybdenum cofactor insertion protein NarJ